VRTDPKSDLQRKMAGHAMLMIFCTLLFGMGLWMNLVGGFEVLPGHIVHFHVPGTPQTWRGAHVGPALNGMMVIGVAFVLPLLDFPDQTAARLGWIIVGEGWANTLFYLSANFNDNRSLTFGRNIYGPANLWSIIGLAPTVVFSMLSFGALIMIGRRALGQFGPRRAQRNDLVVQEN